MAWVILVVAGLFEVSWAIGLKYTEGFARPVRRPHVRDAGLQRSVKWGMSYHGIRDGWCYCCGGFADHVKLMLVNGAALVPVPPVKPLAMGKSTRGVELKSVEDLDQRQIAAWMKQVAAVPGVGGEEEPRPGGDAERTSASATWPRNGGTGAPIQGACMDNVSLLKSLYEAFGRGDIPSVLGAMSPEIMWHEAESNPYMPSGKAWIGPDQVLNELFMKLGSEWDGFAVHPKAFHAAGSSIIVEIRYSGTYKAIGKSMDAQGCHVWDMKDGKLTRFQQYVDTARLRDVMGVR